jgi:D-alanine-D-alanine ligase
VTRIELEPSTCERLRLGAFDVVFPVVHGALGEDGSLQGVLELLALPYVGSDVLASALAMNKAFARVVLAAAGCRVPRGISETKTDALACARRARGELGGAVVVKPSSSGSAIGVARFEPNAADEDVARAIEGAWALDDTVIIEEFVKGREVTCAVLDLAPDGPRALVATEIASPMDAFYTYEARYAPGRSVHTCPANLGPALTERVHAVAVAAHRSLGCRDLSRADMIVGTEPILLEVNTIPGMTPTSLYPEAAVKAGVSFPALCDRLIRNALSRGARSRNAAKPLPKPI